MAAEVESVASRASHVLEQLLTQGVDWNDKKLPGDAARIAHNIVASGYARPPLGQAVEDATKALRKAKVITENVTGREVVAMLLKQGYTCDATVDVQLRALKENGTYDELAPENGRVLRAVLLPADENVEPSDVQIALRRGVHFVDDVARELGAASHRRAAAAVLEKVHLKGVSQAEMGGECIDAKIYGLVAIDNTNSPSSSYSSLPVNGRASFIASHTKHVIVRGDVLVLAAAAYKANGKLRTSAVTWDSVRDAILHLTPSRFYLRAGLRDDHLGNPALGRMLRNQLLLPLRYRPGWFDGISPKMVHDVVVKTNKVTEKLGIEVLIKEDDEAKDTEDPEEYRRWRYFVVQVRDCAVSTDCTASVIQIERIKVNRKVHELSQHAPQLIALHLIEEAVRRCAFDKTRPDIVSRLAAYPRDAMHRIEEGDPSFDTVDIDKSDERVEKPVKGIAVKVAIHDRDMSGTSTIMNFVVGDGSFPRQIDFGIRDKRTGGKLILKGQEYADVKVELLEMTAFSPVIRKKLSNRHRKRGGSVEIFRPPLAFQRYEKAVNVFREKNATAVLDVGCGRDIRLFFKLMAMQSSVTHIVGVDIDRSALEDNMWRQSARDELRSYIHRRERRRQQDAAEREEQPTSDADDDDDDDDDDDTDDDEEDDGDRRPLNANLPTMQLLHGRANALTRSALHFEGEKLAVAAIEVIEHMEQDKAISLLVDVLRGMQPDVMFISTPNIEWNSYIKSQHTSNVDANPHNRTPSNSGFRHWDHKWEATRAEFRHLIAQVIASSTADYDVDYDGVGASDDPKSPTHTSDGRSFATQIAILTRRAQQQAPGTVQHEKKRRRVQEEENGCDGMNGNGDGAGAVKSKLIIRTLAEKQEYRRARDAAAAAEEEEKKMRINNHSLQPDHVNGDGEKSNGHSPDAGAPSKNKKRKKKKKKKKTGDEQDDVEQEDDDNDFICDEVFLYPANDAAHQARVLY